MMNKVNVLLACSAAALSARLAQGGSCYIGAPTHEVFCAVDEAVCNSVEGRFWYEDGNIGSDGCCHCCEGCDHSLETGTDCEAAYYPDGECGHSGGPSEDSPFFNVTAPPSGETTPSPTASEGDGSGVGSCYIGAPTHGVYCAVEESACTSVEGYFFYEQGNIGSNGCCHCCNGCDHSLETGENCEEQYYFDGGCDHEGGPSEDSPFFQEAPTPAPTVPEVERGSCYMGFPGHEVFCAVEQEECTSSGFFRFWYAPGNIGSNGCCHCCNGCDHSLETGENCEEQYYFDGGCDHEGGPSDGNPFADSADRVQDSAASSQSIGATVAVLTALGVGMLQ